MRVALVTDYYLPTLGGVQTAVKSLAESLAAASHTVTVFCPLHPEDREAVIAQAARSGVEVVALPVSPVFRPDGFPFTWPPRRAHRMLVAAFARRRIEVVHTHSEMFAALAGITAARTRGIPVVHTMHGRIDVYTAHVLPVPAVTTHLLAALHARHVDRSGLRVPADEPYTRTPHARAMWRLMAAQSRAAAHVVVPSAHFARKLEGLGVDTPLSVVSNGLEASVLAEIGTPPVRRPDQGSFESSFEGGSAFEGGRTLRALWVGRLSPEKRPEVFATALRAVSGSRVGESSAAEAPWTGDMYGAGMSRGRVESIDSPVRLHGAVPQSEVLAAMREADVLVSTSLDFDNQPMVFLESIASGLPVVHTDPDLAEVLPDGGAFLTRTPDWHGVSQMLTALASDPRHLARASEVMTAHRDTVAQTIDPIVDIYRAVVGNDSVGEGARPQTIPGATWRTPDASIW
ncbi:glycosyltransferase [Brevibacterium litoralis]|uniref:glycosyltransferase n=1 Tax=Brevibacterium litoralis TaxID=3138935 RepID=UPI0032F0608F